jgi:acyl carrier protein
MQTTIDIERDIKSFVVQQFLSGDVSKLSTEGSLLGDTIDSTGVLTLVGYLQERFGIIVSDDDVRPENLDTIENLTVFVAKKLGA